MNSWPRRLRSGSSVALALGVSLGCGLLSPPAAEDGTDPHRLVALLDSIGDRYRRAVHRGGAALDAPEAPEAPETDEPVQSVSEVRRLARRLLPEAPANDPFLAGLAELERRLGAGTAPEEIARLGRRLRDDAAARFRVPTTPGAPPDAERARDLYSMACTECHGPSGEGDTPRAKTLDPPPARFKDSARLRDLSPYRVYNALTFGVPGTAMASFRELPAADRWSLAFFVFQLGHEGEPAEGPVELTLAELADRTDRELVEALRLRGHPSPERGLIQARRFAAFAGPTTGRGGVGGR